jgi:PAS domain S-box-containing protein
MEKESVFRVMAENAPVMIWMSGPDKLCTYFNGRWLNFTGRPFESEIGNGWTEGIHPDDLKRCLDRYSESFDRRQEFKMEYRLRRHDGEYRWVRDTGTPWFDVDGSFAGYTGSCFDITESKLAAEALSQVNARLIEAQEQERTRIARELHDDIGSSLAIVAIEMLRAGQPVPGIPGRKHADIPEIYRKMREIAARVSRLSHQLHPAMLEYLGLTKAVEKECCEFSERHHIPMACSCNDIPVKLDPVVALSVLRVVQEALHNIAKHSHATSVAVTLTASVDRLTLVVLDNGVGFDVEQSRLAPGLGLISMQERIRLLGGEFEIESQPGHGTKISCRACLGQPK